MTVVFLECAQQVYEHFNAVVGDTCKTKNPAGIYGGCSPQWWIPNRAHAFMEQQHVRNVDNHTFNTNRPLAKHNNTSTHTHTLISSYEATPHTHW